jgi:hypothetical protein
MPSTNAAKSSRMTALTLGGVDSPPQCPTKEHIAAMGPGILARATTGWHGNSPAQATEPGVLTEEASWMSRCFPPGRSSLESSRASPALITTSGSKEKFCLHQWREDRSSV